MGLCATAKVITGSGRYARPKLLQPGNREWVTAIEATNSTGWVLPSYIIFKAKQYTRLGWFEDLPDDWRINISNNGWTTDKIGHTNPRDLWSSLKAGCDQRTTLPLITQYELFHSNKWEPKNTISTYTSYFRNIFLSLENTSYKIHQDIAIHILVDQLPDCYKTEVTYLLANIKDSSSEGDNTSGQALVTRGRRPNRRTSSRNLRNEGNNSNSNRREQSNRNSRNKRLICNWYKREGHYERDCHIRTWQLYRVGSLSEP
ncbi:hypothetical protein TSTA_051750 [Talaromyces stipitatus ATCC 10500]|uniref:DDE-1 domain-containing protein n=1 Tax=Talaromyces stipitatus (strain ATCC 10500 / CBS 375.48 / QM 6759 / NRRL 1006) TaxID=441959 RepID=B8MJN9_TALSN|nr:uncharacterized protein TSTA_051750 [Talaromyces stipitatus ATCC 10500]EED15738.1 hypothetical protein TSTA_051750 [Talaromyces stipitatus ATCC 10500]